MSPRSTRARRPPAASCSTTPAGRWPSTSASTGRSSRRAGWVEHDAAEIWENTRAVTAGALARAQAQARGHRRRRDHQPARDHGGLGPDHRRAGPQRDRLAGHPHRRALPLARRARRRRRPVPRPGRAAAGHLLLRAEDRAGSSTTSTGPGNAPRPASCSSGTIDTWLVWNMTGGPAGGLHVTDVTNAVPHHADGPATRCRGTPGIAAEMGIPLRCCPRSVPPQRFYGEGRAAGVARRACRSPASSATSRRRRSGRPAWRPARPRTPTAPATSCCSTPARHRSQSANGLLTTVCYRIGDEPAGLRAGGVDRGHRLAGAVAARQPRADLVGVRDRGAGPHGRRQRRRLLRAGVLRTVRPALALRRARGDRRTDPVRQPRPTSPGRCSRRPRSRPGRCSTR